MSKSLVNEAREASETALDQIRCLTQELARVTTDRDRQRNFCLFFQKQALDYEHKYHQSAESLTKERLKQNSG